VCCVALHINAEESHLAIYSFFSCSPFSNKHSLFNRIYFPSLSRPSEPHALYGMTNKFQAYSSCLVISDKADRVSYHIHTCQVLIFICLDTQQIYLLACDYVTVLTTLVIWIKQVSAALTYHHVLLMKCLVNSTHVMFFHGMHPPVLRVFTAASCLLYECLRMRL